MVSMSVLFLLSFLGSDSKSPFAMAPSRFLDKTIAKSERGISFSASLASFSHWSAGSRDELVSVVSNVIHFGIFAVRSRLVDLVAIRRTKGLFVAVLREGIWCVRRERTSIVGMSRSFLGFDF